MARIWILIGTLVLGACGADVAGTAATAASLQATQAKQAKQAKDQQQRIEQQLAEALKTEEARASAPTQ